jgi:hypothetical protein
MGGKLKWLHEHLVFIVDGEKLWAMPNDPIFKLWTIAIQDWFQEWGQNVQVRFFNYFDIGLNVLNLNLWFCLGISSC